MLGAKVGGVSFRSNLSLYLKQKKFTQNKSSTYSKFYWERSMAQFTVWHKQQPREVTPRSLESALLCTASNKKSGWGPTGEGILPYTLEWVLIGSFWPGQDGAGQDSLVILVPGPGSISSSPFSTAFSLWAASHPAQLSFIVRIGFFENEKKNYEKINFWIHHNKGLYLKLQLLILEDSFSQMPILNVF